MKTPVVLSWRRAVLALLLAAAPASLAAQPGAKPPPIALAAAPAPGEAAKPTLITTFSGGISLGAYQAGVDWALLEFYRAANRNPAFADSFGIPRYQFGTAAGASAGNINALLWAVETCTEWGDWQAPDESLFWDLWTSIDVRDLLPDTVRPDADLALLNRGFIGQIKKLVEDRTRDPRLSLPCQVPVGITLTRVQPDTVQLGEIPVHTQRYVVPLLARVDTVLVKGAEGGRARYVRRMVFDHGRVQRNQRHRLGAMRQPRLVGKAIPLDSIFEVVKASSAFPLAFQPVILSMLDNRDTLQPDEMFLDGGLFDNNPVDLALVLHSEAIKDTSLTAPRADHQLLYVDPDNLRPRATGCAPHPLGGKEPRCAPPAADRPQASGGIRPTLSTLISAFTSAREYELFALTRKIDVGDRKWQLLTTREHRVVGKQLMAFGAFLNLAFREHDFYVGAYDAIHYVLCAPGNRSPSHCTYDNVIALRDSLALPGEADDLIGTLARAEFGKLEVPRLERPLTPRERLKAEVYAAVYDALRAKPDTATAARERAREACMSSMAYFAMCTDGTDVFLSTFRDRLVALDTTGTACRTQPAGRPAGLVRVVWSQYELCQLVNRRPDEYFQGYFDRIMRRLVQVERDVDARLATHQGQLPPREPAKASPMQAMTEAVAFLYESTSLRPHVGWRWNSIPRDARTPWRYAPSYLSLDAHWDGADATWEPTRYLRARPGVGVSFPFGVRWNNPAAYAPHWYYAAGVKLVARNPNAWGSLLGTRAETGLVLLQPSRDLWSGRMDPTLAHELNFTLLADRLRLGIRTSVLGPPADGGQRMQVSLGLNDVGGLIYWGGVIKRP
jgi:predicted acylesterase/phospholipase RssA